MDENRGGSAASPALLDELPPLAAAKLAAPRQREGLVARPRLTHTFDAGADAALTLVSAPPGYGKTTAVRVWCAASATAWAWVTLDGHDNDPARLWTYAATAVDRVREGLGRRALQRLRVAGMPVEIAVDELMNGIAAYGRELTLVLDDCHAVTNGECLASLRYAVERLPPNGRLILLTRADPQIGLAQLRARGTLAELRASELAFTRSEARELLVVRGGLRLQDSDVDVLMKRTEGWPAAVYLAALWLRTVSDHRRAVRRFGGDHRYVAEYLSREVLASLDAEQRSLLLGAAVLGRFTAALCDGVLDRSDSASALAELEQRNMLVLPLERQEWFRVHSLFAQFAAALASIEPGAADRIHRRAAGWLRSRGLMVEATEHAAAAGDHQTVAELLSQYHLALLRKGAPGPCSGGCAHFLMRSCWTTRSSCWRGRPLRPSWVTSPWCRRRFLELASRAKQTRPERFGAYADGLMSMVRSVGIDAGVEDAVVEGRRAVELAARSGAGELLVDGLAGLAHAQYFAGQLDKAWATAYRAVEHPDAERIAPGYVMARSTLALVAADRGRLGSARVHAEAARTVIGRITSSRSWLVPTHRSRSARCWPARETSSERNVSSSARSVSSADQVATVHHARLLVRLATRGACAAGSTRPSGPSCERARRSPSSPTREWSRLSRRKPGPSSRRPGATPLAARWSSAPLTPSWR